jgi:hypothetical protein
MDGRPTQTAGQKCGKFNPLKIFKILVGWVFNCCAGDRRWEFRYHCTNHFLEALAFLQRFAGAAFCHKKRAIRNAKHHQQFWLNPIHRV